MCAYTSSVPDYGISHAEALAEATAEDFEHAAAEMPRGWGKGQPGYQYLLETKAAKVAKRRIDRTSAGTIRRIANYLNDLTRLKWHPDYRALQSRAEWMPTAITFLREGYNPQDVWAWFTNGDPRFYHAKHDNPVSTQWSLREQSTAHGPATVAD